MHTCTHIDETGSLCKSFAVQGERYCVHHLRYRARRLRMAQASARGQRFHFTLPPLDSMHSVQSALSQLAEAIAYGVIDRRDAHTLLSVLRVASANLRHPEKWQSSLYESAEPAPLIDVAAEYGLPADLDIDTSPDVAFPPPTETEDASPLPAPSPGDGIASTASADDPFGDLNPLERVSPFDIELEELRIAEGAPAMFRRINQFEREELRRKRGAATRAARQRLSALAFHRNLERLASKLADEKLARLQSTPPADAPKPPASVPASSSCSPQNDENARLTPTG